MLQQLQYCTCRWISRSVLGRLLLCCNRRQSNCKLKLVNRAVDRDRQNCNRAARLLVARPRNLREYNRNCRNFLVFELVLAAVENVANPHLHFPQNCARRVDRRIPDGRTAFFAWLKNLGSTYLPDFADGRWKSGLGRTKADVFL